MSYTIEKKTCAAYGPRAPRLTILPLDRLVQVYNKYKLTFRPQPGQVQLLFVFAHGTGMNKLVWHYHIDQLFQKSQQPNLGYYIDVCVSVDAVSHGDSALANEGKIGPVYWWDELGRDLLAVIHHENEVGDLVSAPDRRIITVGHSLGGNAAFMAGFFDPNVVDCAVTVDAVLYTEPLMRPRFTKIFKKIAGLLIDHFDTEDEVKLFYDMLFYNTMDKRVLKDFVADEIVTVVDENEEASYRTKASKFAQMATYLGLAYSLNLTMHAIQSYRTSVCHVTGNQGTWNQPQLKPWVRSNLPEGKLVKTADIDGTHLVHGDNPDGMVQVLVELAQDRTKVAQTNIDQLKQQGDDRAKLLEVSEEKLYAADLVEVAAATAKL